MPFHEILAVHAELKFANQTDKPGYFEGLASVYHHEDSHQDVVMPGAFTASLAERKARSGKWPKMFFNHSAFTGGSKTPIGKWDDMIETPQGLAVKGHLIGMTHPDIQQVYELMQEGEADSLSIAFLPRPGGITMTKSAAGPVRQLDAVDLFAVDVVCDPSNSLAKITQVKSQFALGTPQSAADAVAAAMMAHRDMVAGRKAPTPEQAMAMMAHLQAAHMALTGHPMPVAMQALPTLREFETAIGMMFGLSNSQARAATERGFKSLSRDENSGSADAAAETKAARDALAESLVGFTLPKF